MALMLSTVLRQSRFLQAGFQQVISSHWTVLKHPPCQQSQAAALPGNSFIYLFICILIYF